MSTTHLHRHAGDPFQIRNHGALYGILSALSWTTNFAQAFANMESTDGHAHRPE